MPPVDRPPIFPIPGGQGGQPGIPRGGEPPDDIIPDFGRGPPPAIPPPVSVDDIIRIVRGGARAPGIPEPTVPRGVGALLGRVFGVIGVGVLTSEILKELEREADARLRQEQRDRAAAQRKRRARVEQIGMIETVPGPADSEVTVTATRPILPPVPQLPQIVTEPFPEPAVAPQIPQPAPPRPAIPQPTTIPQPEIAPPQPQTTPKPSTRPVTRPAPLPAPLPLPAPRPIPAPFGLPFPAPLPLPLPIPQPTPLPFATPAPTPLPQPLTLPQPTALPSPTAVPMPTTVPFPTGQPTPRAPTDNRRCQEVKRRRRRKGKCREGFFREFPGKTRFIEWREVDCRTREETPLSKAKRRTDELLDDLLNP